jgi:hypothetical protein
MSSSNAELFADLFAHRFSLLDIYPENESEIIRRLKLKLYEWGYERLTINEILFDFYREFSINITLEEIENTNVMIYNDINSFRNSNNRNLIALILTMLNNNLPVEETNEPLRLTEEEFNNLEIKTITEQTDNECSICIDKFEIDTKVIKLPCNHMFHINCIRSHLINYNNRCPMCRNEINETNYN